MVRISDARMSGTSYGACILHVAPESYVGGPLALVRNGDRIKLDVGARSIDLDLPEAELAKRRAEGNNRSAGSSAAMAGCSRVISSRPTKAQHLVGFLRCRSAARWPPGTRRRDPGLSQATRAAGVVRAERRSAGFVDRVQLVLRRRRNLSAIASISARTKRFTPISAGMLRGIPQLYSFYIEVLRLASDGGGDLTNWSTRAAESRMSFPALSAAVVG